MNYNIAESSKIKCKIYKLSKHVIPDGKRE